MPRARVRERRAFCLGNALVFSAAITTEAGTRGDTISAPQTACSAAMAKNADKNYERKERGEGPH
jgi:hypothetical protein